MFKELAFHERKSQKRNNGRNAAMVASGVPALLLSDRWGCKVTPTAVC
jgi:hypothetical protein